MIRFCKEEDTRDLAVISSENVDPAWSREDFNSALKNAQARVFVTGEKPVGYGVFYFACDEGEIPSIAVDKSMRRQGIGNEILGEIIDFAKSQSIRRIFLEVRQSNTAAIAFYLKNGFSEVGRRPKFYNHPVEDGLILELKL